MLPPLPLTSDEITAADHLAAKLKLTNAAARLLVTRGLTDAVAAERFLNPSFAQLHSPWLLRGMQAAVSRIAKAIEAREPVLIYGDYDVDGLTSAVILRKALQMMGCEPALHIPHRLNDGHGLQEAVIESAASAGTRLCISVDTGIRALAATEAARRCGIDLIITDHHLCGDELPQATAIINPHQPGCDYPDKNLCGVGVVFKLVHALFESAGRVTAGEYPPWLQAFLKIVALGTIADAVPLTGENRVFVKVGIAGLRRPVNPGLQSLLANAMEGRPELRAEDIAFRVAPRLNAAGRMDRADRVLDLFAASAAEAPELARLFEEFNRERQAVEQQVLGEIQERMSREPELGGAPIVVVDGAGWHRGVLGIVASRVVERCGKAALVITREGDVAHGSGRSPAGTHLLNVLENCSDLMMRYGGHAQAVGFALLAADVSELRRRLWSAGAEAGARLPISEMQRNCFAIALNEITHRFTNELARFEPFGQSNPEPLFYTTGARVVAPPQVLKDKHLKLMVEQRGMRLEALGWNMAAEQDLAMAVAVNGAPAPIAGVAAGATVDLAFRIETTTHPQYGRRTQLILKDRPSCG